MNESFLRIVVLAVTLAATGLTPGRVAAGESAASADSAAGEPKAATSAEVEAAASAEPASAVEAPAGAKLPKGDFGPIDETEAARIVDRLLGQVSETEPEPVRLSLAEAVRIAVENNPGIRADAEVPKSAAWATMEATGAFDPTFRVNSTAERLKAPSGSALASGLQTFEEDSVKSGASISKLLRTGGTVGLDWSTQIIDTNSVFYRINPRYDNRLALSLRQPLLRGIGGIDENTTVLVAKARTEEALADFEAELSAFVSETVDAYWSYVEAAAELEVSRRSVALARELVRDAEAKVEVGLLPPVAVKEAEADAAAREERALIVENVLTTAGRQLQHQVMLGASGSRIAPQVVPAEEHVVEPVDLNRPAALRTAVEHRAEIHGAAVGLARRRLEEKKAKNEKLPSLDLVARYGRLGLTGDARPFLDDDGNVQISPYDGDYEDSLNDLFSEEFHDIAIGLELEVPLGNAQAKARASAASIEVRRASRELEETISGIALDVDKALADVGSAAKRVTASKYSRDLAEENLRNQQRRFELGSATTKDLLDYQQKLAVAMASQVRAITDHARSVTRLREADGTLLTRFGIEVERPDAPGKPWWYRF